MATWQNNDGLYVRYGNDQGRRGNRPGSTQNNGKVRELVVPIDLKGAASTRFPADLNNDGTNDGFTGLDAYIPAGAKIIDIDFNVTEAAAGGTSYEVGTYQINGTAIDADGIINENSGAEVGALLNTKVTQNSYIAFTTVGTYTAGKVQVLIQYML